MRASPVRQRLAPFFEERSLIMPDTVQQCHVLIKFVKEGFGESVFIPGFTTCEQRVDALRLFQVTYVGKPVFLKASGGRSSVAGIIRYIAPKLYSVLRREGIFDIREPDDVSPELIFRAFFDATESKRGVFVGIDRLILVPNH